jgi:tellurite resistance-related uncharacterized protein
MAQQFVRLRAVFAGHTNGCAKTAGIMQAQHPRRGVQIKMVVLAGRVTALAECQTARHAQMQQEDAVVQIQQQVFAPATHAVHPLPDQLCGLTDQGPAQRFA